MLKDQINLLLEDGPVQGLKTGMLGSSENILEIVKVITEHNIKYSIVDPVIRAGDGSMLASDASIAVLRKRLIPACFMVTPNIVEAQILTGIRIANEDDILKAAKALKETGVKWVLIKGGHLDSDMAIDLLYDGTNEYFFETKKIESKNVRGTGCMMASAVCAFLVRGLSPEEAVDKAKAYVFSKILRAVPLGKGSLQALHGTLQTLLAGPHTAVGASSASLNGASAHNVNAVERSGNSQHASDMQSIPPEQGATDAQNAAGSKNAETQDSTAPYDADSIQNVNANNTSVSADTDQIPAGNNDEKQSISFVIDANDSSEGAHDTDTESDICDTDNSHETADNAAERCFQPKTPEAIEIDSDSVINRLVPDTSLDDDIYDDLDNDSDETLESESVDESNDKEDEDDNPPPSAIPAINEDDGENKGSRGTTYVAISTDSTSNIDGKKQENANNN
jgi:hydroxymethylpyrimidine kinase/phosphomethylpyrimidine kinase